MLASFLIVASLLGGEPGNEVLKTEVAKLVRGLDADTQTEREAAVQGLLKLGPAALDYLPSPETQPDESVRAALLKIRQTLQKLRALESIEPSTVTLQGRMKVSKVLAEIQRQSGNKIADLPRSSGTAIPDPEIDVSFNKTPFWTALDKTLDEAQLSIYPYGQPKALQIVPRGPNDLPRSGRAVFSGPLRIEPIEVMTKRELRSDSPPAMQIALEVAWEPRLQPIAIKQRMADVKAVDSNHASLVAENPQAETEAPARTGSSAVAMGVALAMPAQPIKEIASLQGTLKAMMLGRVEEFRFANLLKGNQEKRIAEATVTVSNVRKNGDSWEVNILLRYEDAGDALESHRNWVLLNEAFLVDANGKQIQPDSTETTHREKNLIGIGYVFAVADFPQNAEFVYKTPGMIVTKDFPYTVRGIKMP